MRKRGDDVDTLFCLTFYSQPNGNYRESFHIGLFKSHEEAEQIAARYRKEVTGFKDYKCDAEIVKIPVIGHCEDAIQVYRFYGWNINDASDEVDIVDSDCYVNKASAEAACKKAQIATPRQEWALNVYTIGQCDWQDGFVRVPD